MGQMAKIRPENLKLLDEDWEIIAPTHIMLYRPDGSLTEKGMGVMEIKNPAHVQDLSNPVLYDYRITIGKIASL